MFHPSYRDVLFLKIFAMIGLRDLRIVQAQKVRDHTPVIQSTYKHSKNNGAAHIGWSDAVIM